MAGIALRPVEDGDLPLFFAWMSDPGATRVAAFIAEDPTDRAAFDAHWARIRAGSRVVMRTVVADGAVVGHVGEYGDPGNRQVTYWIDREHWGRGLATAALRAYLDETPARPPAARAGGGRQPRFAPGAGEVRLRGHRQGPRIRPRPGRGDRRGPGHAARLTRS